MNQQTAPCRGVGITTEATDCFYKASEAADRQLERKIKLVRTVLAPGEQDRLLKAQEIWRRYRAETCAAEQELYGAGTARWPAYYACLEAEARQRLVDMDETYGWRLRMHDLNAAD